MTERERNFPFYAGKAEEARSLAKGVESREAREALLAIAASYDALAQSARLEEERKYGKPGQR